MAETLDRTRFVMGCMFMTLKDCGHKPEHVREVLHELGFTSAPKVDAGEREYLSWVIPPHGVKGPDEAQRKLAQHFDESPRYSAEGALLTAGVETSRGGEQ